MQRNRLQFKTRHPYLPIVRYDVFEGAEPKRAFRPRIIGQAEQFEQLKLPEPAPAARDRKVVFIEPVYVPYEESA